MKLNLRVWRQDGPADKGRLVAYLVEDADEDLGAKLREGVHQPPADHLGGGHARDFFEPGIPHQAAQLAVAGQDARGQAGHQPRNVRVRTAEGRAAAAAADTFLTGDSDLPRPVTPTAVALR